jgi:hypothetical protein
MKTANCDMHNNGVNYSVRPRWPNSLSAARWLRWALLVILFAAALFIAWRRVAGALVSPLDPPAMLATGVVLAAAAVGARFSASFDKRFATLVSIVVLAIGASLSLPGTSAGGLAVFWTLILGEEIGSWWLLLRRQSRARMPRSACPTVPQRTAGQASSGTPTVPQRTAGQVSSATPLPPSTAEQASSGTLPEQVSSGTLSEQVLQQLTRSVAADGSETLGGLLRLPLLPGQRAGSIHVAFCPPFAGVPEVIVEQLAGPACRVKTAQLLPYGARLDLKLTATADAPTSVLLRFAARAAV